MAANTELWTAVVAAYDSDGLITLTNIRDRSASAVDTTVGQTAAQAVIDLWPAYTHVAYDSTDALHVEAAILGVIAILWRRGGTSTTIEQVKWDEVFGEDGVLAKIRVTGARGHKGPKSNSGVSQRAETLNGRTVRGWSDRASLPDGLVARRIPADFNT